tara:strand:+ start:2708 stop:3748 length:1041 start_codon:yes stop_codon:yes gene_type:complete
MQTQTNQAQMNIDDQNYFLARKEEFETYYKENDDKFKQAIKKIKEVVETSLTNDFSDIKIESRIKESKSALNKFSENYQKKLEETNTPYQIKDEITDLIGIRVICLYESDISKIQDILYNNFQILGKKDKTKKKKNSFGYKALHLDAKLNEDRTSLPEYECCKDLKFEIQMRTIIQDAWSNLDHKLQYKSNIPENISRRINALAALFEIADLEFESARDELKDYNEKERTKEDGDLTPSYLIKKMEDKFSSYPYPFNPRKVDDLISEINEIRNITKKELCTSLNEHFDITEKYKESCRKNPKMKKPHPFNPMTQLRFILMCSNDIYAQLLFKSQINSFSKFRESSK